MMTSQEYIKWLQGFLEALQDIDLDREDMGIALTKIEDRLKDVVDYKQQTHQIFGVPNSPTITVPHHSGTPFNNPFTINCTTNGELFTPSTTNTNITI